MKEYHIRETFKGSQDGINVDTFREGTQCILSNGLAEQALKMGWAKPIDPENRETKVVEPDETKTEEVTEEPTEEVTEEPTESPDLEAMGHKDLLAYAKDQLGLKFKGNPSRETILQAIAEA